jgi:putative ABC transport system permease protein
MNTLLNDLSYAIRVMRKNPGFTTVVLVTLALGIGANTALFSVIDAVLLRPLPFRDPGRLVAMLSVDLKDSTQGGDISYPAFLDWKAQSSSFEAMSVWNTNSFTYTGGDQPESVPSAVVSANLFSLLGVTPVLGRTFIAAEDQPGSQQLPLLLSYEFWQSHFAGDRQVLGRALTFDDISFNVVGVMPPGFQFPVQSARAEVWTTIAYDLRGKNGLATQRGASYLKVIGRLQPGVEIAQAHSDLTMVQHRLNLQYPENRPRAVVVQSEAEAIAGSARPALLMLLGAVGFVLLIACVNVANLLLTRATARRKEFTVRSALGAGRSAIVRQLLIESMLLAVTGGALGLLAAPWCTRVLVAMAPQALARTAEIALDFRVLGFSLVVSLLTGLLFGLAPAAQLSRPDLTGAMSDSARGTSDGPAGVRLRGTLLVSQLAIAFMLLIGAGLLLRSFVRLYLVDPGFRADHVLTFLLEVPSHRHPRAQRHVFVHELLQSARSLPGVKSASAIFGLPLSDDQGLFTSLEIEGRPVPPAQRPRVAFRIVESEYFKALGIPLLQGRTFTTQDEEGGAPLAIVNETLARQMFHGEDPLGRRIRPNISFGDQDDAPMREIVGVTGDVKSVTIGGNAVPEVYAPQTPSDFIGEMTVVVRTGSDPNMLIPALRSLVSSKDKDLPLRDIRTMDEYVRASISTPRFEAMLLTVLAALAFVLTAVGLYGVVSYSVAQRTREIGIRIALGAQRASILAMVVREGVLLAAIGAGAGLVASFFVARVMRTLLYGIGATDPATFVTVPLLLMAVAFLASYLPARRAMLVDPMVVLRDE